MKTATLNIDLPPLSANPAFAAIAAQLVTLSNKRAELTAEQRTLEQQLREPAGEVTGFADRVIAVMAGTPLRKTHDSLRERHLAIRVQLEGLDVTMNAGDAERRKVEGQARADAVRALDPAHRVLCRRAADAIDSLLATAAEEQALIDGAWSAGYSELALSMRVLPLQILDALEPDSLTQRHIRELRSR